jgi:N-acetylglucosaminyldiphosphoundecaprenol N-acetyl-beta-D-mannosaminyltransferase
LSELFARETHCILGLPFDAIGLADAVRQVQDAAARRQRCFLSTPNLNWLVACQTDPALRNSVIDSDLSIVDGMPLVWVAWWLGIPIHERVAGSAVFEFLRSSEIRRVTVYFFGGPEGIAETACKRLNESACGLVCVGYHCPGFGSIEDMSSEKIIADINASGAEFVVVALGAKKGQAWIEHNRTRLSAPIISHLGAVVNFVAGTVSRAPGWMQRSGLEWLWRIKEETSLWRRYASDGLVFLGLLLTRVIPNMWLLLIHKLSPRASDASGVEVHEENGLIVIRLLGVWAGTNLGPIRECFERAARSGQNIRLDMAGVSYVDSGFLGLLLLLHGACRQTGQRLELGQTSKVVKRILRYSCAEYLLHEQ